jgi:drug/metabolite transporter (DMT)-like permease
MAAAAILFAIVLLRRIPFPRQAGAWRSFGLLGLTMIALPYGLLFWAERRITSGMAAVIYALLPLLVALLSPILLHTSVPRRAVYAMTVAMGGIAYLFVDLSASAWMLAGGFAVLAAVASNAWGTVYAKMALKGIHPLVSTAVQFLVGGVTLLLASAAVERGQLAGWSSSSLLATAYLVVFGSILAFTIYYWLLQTMPPYQLSSLNFIVPILAVLLGALLIHEAVPLRMILAMLAVLASVAMVLSAGHDPEILSLRAPAAEPGEGR